MNLRVRFTFNESPEWFEKILDPMNMPHPTRRGVLPLLPSTIKKKAPGFAGGPYNDIS